MQSRAQCQGAVYFHLKISEMFLLAFEYNQFNGVIINSDRIPENSEIFSNQLSALLRYTKQQNKAVVWLTLPINLSHLISISTDQGFTFHNCLPEEVTLVFKTNPQDFVPFIPTHSLGAGGLVQNKYGEILVIKEHGARNYKLPGGHIELGEKIEDAVIREVLEETGINTTFDTILGMASTHPYRFGKSNIYIICKLSPLSEDINILDTQEIDDARWITPKDYLADDNNNVFNKYLVKSLLNGKGLVKSTLDLRQFSNLKHEMFLAAPDAP
ncbi:MAG: NUDIX domain-containing protein [Paraglaciecola sp.]|uniref:NUDIX domain-containing protein n=1 Tax=Paraglaciecola sp. TaxID=1920173 RepID=UPI0032997677